MFFPVNGDQYKDFVSLHLPMTGENNSTTFTDVSLNQETISVFGDTKILTASSKWGNGSGYFDGTGDYLSVSDDSSLELTSGSYTIEMWINLSSYPSLNSHSIFFSKYVTTGDQRSFFLSLINLDGDYKLRFVVFSGGTSSPNVIHDQAWTPSLGTWYHVAICRSTDLFMFVDGVQLGTEESTLNIFDGSAPFTLGQGDGSSFFNGYMQDLRVTKGVSRYTENFNKPTGPMAKIFHDSRIRKPFTNSSFYQVARIGL